MDKGPDRGRVAFARGHRFIKVPNALIAEATIAKQAVYAYLLERSEQEIVLSPTKLRDAVGSHVDLA